MPITQKFRRISSALLGAALVLQGSLSFADDTEIYLSRGVVNVKPNLFFILDDSLSMQWCLDWDWRYPKWDNGKNRDACKDKSYNNRFDELKRALNTLLPDTSVMKNVRFGMMWMNNRNGGYTKDNIGLPVDDIDNVRQKALDLINTHKLPDALKTPIDRSLYDVARYFNGFPKGKYPDNKNVSGQTFPGHSAKEAFNLPNEDSLPSPIIAACQPNHVVILTDGDAWYDDNYVDIRELIGRDKGGNWDKKKEPCARQPGASSIYAEACVPELAEWMHSTDQMPDSEFKGNQTITTHVIALALNSDKDNNPNKVKKRQIFLKNIVNSGGGNYYEADDGDQLLKSFRDILEQVADVKNATVVNPSAVSNPVDTRVNDQIYYPLFRPTSNDRWPGNIKRYRFAAVDKLLDGKPVQVDGKTLKEPAIVDVNGNRAFNGSGDFVDSAQSFWSEAADGANISQGGAASQLPRPAQRKLYFSEGNVLKTFNKDNVPLTLAGTVSATQWNELFHYIRGEGEAYIDDGSGANPSDGKNEKEGEKESGTGTLVRPQRKQLGDPMHSQPVAIDYADGVQGLLVGTNEGFVHLFNRENGVEEFAFMPEALLKNIPKLHDNNRSTQDEPHPYGMDNTVTLWIDDKNNNNKVDAGETAYAYASMRRGGRNLYALDISDHSTPKLLWQIIGGSAGFEKLGQTWSQPVKSKILYKGKATDVLIFGGGYDPVEDNLNEENSTYANGVSMGNDIYIVDAKSGAKLWSASTSGLDLAGKMKYSIPASLSVGTNNDGLAEQIFAPDTGGQIWRFAVNTDKNSNDFVKLGAANGLFASLGGPDTANARHFYQAAAVTSYNGGLAVALGSGYRAHPLNTHGQDRSYLLRAPAQGSETQPTLYESDLTDVRSVQGEKQQKGQEGSAAQAQPVAASSPHGWYIKLQRSGEKVLSTPLIVRNEVFFNSYQPTLSGISCVMPLGSNYSYRVALDSGSFVREETLINANGIAGTPFLVSIPMPATDATGKTLGDTSVPLGQYVIPCPGDCPTDEVTPLLCNNKKGCKTFWMDLSD